MSPPILRLSCDVNPFAQANPLNHKQPDIHLMGGSRGMLAAKHPLVVPMLLRLSHFKLSSYVVLVVSKQKGITLVFKTDPLQNVDINSTFDSIAVIQNFIQREIEGQLRQMFREDLPGIIHRLSQQWVKAKVEAPYLNKRPPPAPSTRRDTISTSDIFPHRPLAASDIGVHPQLHRTQSSLGSRRPRAASASGASVAGSSQPKSVSLPLPPSHEPSTSSHPDLENFDPTYGLRPEGLPTKSVFQGFSSLFTPNKGLADLTEELEDEGSSEMGEYEYNSFDMVDWDDSASSPPASVYHDRDRDTQSSTEYETIPAVGGGTITRPRIYHSQSAIQTVPLAKSLSSLPTRSYSQTTLNMSTGLGMYHPHRSGIVTPASNPYSPEYPPMSAGAGPSKLNPNGATAASVSGIPHHAPAAHMGGFNPAGRPRTPDSFESQPSRSSSGPSRTLSTDLTDHASYEHPSALSSSASNAAADSATATSHIYMRRPPSERRMSVTSTTSTNNNNNSHNSHDISLLSTSPSNVHSYDQQHQGPAKIVLRPTLNNSIHQLSTLSISNHTLSPYTRDLSHFTVRSVPPRGVGVGAGALGFGGAAMGEKAPVKAKRKRMYRLGGKKPEPSRADEAAPTNADNKNPRQIGEEHLHHRHFHHHHHGASSPTPPSEFDVEDMDRYFPSSQDDLEGYPSATTATGVSRQQPRLRQKHPLGYPTAFLRPPSLRQPSSVYAPP